MYDCRQRRGEVRWGVCSRRLAHGQGDWRVSCTSLRKERLMFTDGKLEGTWEQEAQEG